MTVITAVPLTNHLQRHDVPPPQRLLPSTPDATYYAQHTARQNMARHELPPQAIRPLTQRGQPLPASDAHRVTISSSTSTSLTGTMRFDATASHGLRGAFAGSWSSARTSLAYSAEPTGSPCTQRDTDRMDEDDKYDTSSDEPGSLSSLSRRPSLARFSRLSSESLTEMFGRLPAPSESDLILGTSKPRHHPVTFCPDAQHARARSWQGDESVRLPPLRMLDSPRVAQDDLPRVDASEPPAKRACVQLPSFPDYFEGSSRLSFSSSSVRSRGGTSSPPPSPSPSAASWSTPAHSTGHTDTEPTDEEDLAMGEDERQSGYSPQSLAAWKSLQERYARPRAISSVRPSSPLDDDSANPSSPQHVAVGAANQAAASGCQAPRSRPSKSAAEHEHKTYRFVASTLSQDALPFEAKHASAHAVERGRESVVRPGAKRKHGRSPSPSSASSEDLPLSAVTKVPALSTTRPALKAKHHAPSDAPPSAATDPPKRRGRPPRPAYDIECLAPLHPDSPEAKGHFPEYRYEQQRGLLPCAFDGCGARLTGKKAEMTNHLKTHFFAVGGRTLRCPWLVTDKDGAAAVCGQTFRDSANMGRHVTTRHAKVEEYQCGRCGRPFSRRDAALRHMKTMCSPEKQKAREARRRSFGDADADAEWEVEGEGGGGRLV